MMTGKGTELKKMLKAYNQKVLEADYDRVVDCAIQYARANPGQHVLLNRQDPSKIEVTDDDVQ